MILQIKHEVDWKLIRQKNQVHINKENIRKNKHGVDYDYKVGYNFIIIKHTAYKYKMPYMVPFLITQCFANGTVNLQCGAIKIKYNIRWIKPYKYDTNVEDSSLKTMYDNVNI